MQQKQFIDLQISSTCFGKFFAHLQERKIVIYSMWYKSPDCCRWAAWSAACSTPHAVNHNLALLKMGKELPEICWANLKINKLLLLHPVGHLLHLYSGVSRCALMQQSTTTTPSIMCVSQDLNCSSIPVISKDCCQYTPYAWM